ncbi:MAG: thiol-disulfide oxidoreductase DCC family protein [Gammaproteobacteria bacterium]
MKYKRNTTPPGANAPARQRPRVFYDGGCPVCRREIAHYRRLDREGRVHWHDIDAHPETLHDHGINRRDAMRRFHVIDTTGRVRSGADAFTVVWAELPGWRLVGRVVRGLRLHVPMEWAYRLWAARRWRRLQRTRCAT